MPLNAQVSLSPTHSEIHIVTLAGNLDETVRSDLESTLTQALQNSQTGILLDMSAVEFISSAGLGVLTIIHTRAKTAQKQMTICHVPPAVYKTFKLCMFDKLFPIFDDQPAALKAMAKTT